MIYVLYGRATPRHYWDVQMIAPRERLEHWQREYTARYGWEYAIRAFNLSGAIVQGVDYPDHVRKLPQGDDTR